jgi:hypothetical protein
VAYLSHSVAENFQDIWPSPDRPVRVMADSSAPGLLLVGPTRSPVCGDRRSPAALGLRPHVCLSPTGSDTDSDPEVQAIEGQASPPNSPLLDGRAVAIGGQVSPLRGAQEAQVPGVARGQHDIRPPAPIAQQALADGLAAFRAVVSASGVSDEVAEFLASSWRRSTQAQYLSAWRCWSTWCDGRGLVPTEVCVNILLEYLLYLANTKNFAWSTVGVHRSAISYMLQPMASPSVGEHPLIVRFMRALFLRRPPAVHPRWTWDVSTVLACVRDWGLAPVLNLRRLTWKLAFLTALFSARRVSDLTLLRISPEYFQRTDHTAVFQPVFGAKQDRPGHQNPLVVLKQYELDLRLCPLALLDEYLTRTAFANRPTNLFLTTVLPQGIAARGTIKRWIVSVLSEAGVEGSAGSTRAAAASFALASNVSLSTVLEAADWSRSTTMFRHYVRLLPPEVLAHVASNPARNVQDAALDILN